MEKLDTLFKFLKITDHEKADSKCDFNITDEISKINIINWNYDLKKNKNKELLKEKIIYLTEFNPDLLVIQECTYHECIYFKNFFNSVNWYGDGKDGIYGVAVLSNRYETKIICYNFYRQKFRYIVPYEISINGITILFLVVWTKNYLSTNNIFNLENKKDDVHDLDYTNNIFEAIKVYDNLLRIYSDVMIIGDFNSNDKKNDKKRQEKIVNLLIQYDIHNCSNYSNNDTLNEHNFETEVTYYHDYLSDKAATNDYCFLKKSKNINLLNFGIGYPDKWIKYSDHFPLWIELSVKNTNLT